MYKAIPRRERSPARSNLNAVERPRRTAYSATPSSKAWERRGDAPNPSRSIEPSIPILMFCIVYGLSMDYEMFLLSRIKEDYGQGIARSALVARRTVPLAHAARRCGGKS
ncbi:MAG: MMPL family transporter [Pseudonocardiaceae bacterium]